MKTHGLRKHPLYSVWHNMKKRCEYSKHRNYPNYGGRGIIVCDRWQQFQNFFDDNINQWQPNLTIERMNVDGDYHPDNCTWIPAKRQAWNKRPIKRNLPTGVYKNGSKYGARIRIDNKLTYLGTYTTPEEAGKVYQTHKRARNGFD